MNTSGLYQPEVSGKRRVSVRGGESLVRTSIFEGEQGSGTLGKLAIAPFIVQYVAPHTGYGPVAAGPDGVAYLTLRATMAMQFPDGSW